MTYFLEIHLDTSLESEDFAGVFKKKKYCDNEIFSALIDAPGNAVLSHYDVHHPDLHL